MLFVDIEVWQWLARIDHANGRRHVELYSDESNTTGKIRRRMSAERKAGGPEGEHAQNTSAEAKSSLTSWPKAQSSNIGDTYSPHAAGDKA